MARCLACGRRALSAPGCPGHRLAASPPPTGEWPAGLDADYQPLRPLGAGGQAVVFAARRRADGAEVAIKLAHTGEGAARLEREAAALRAVGEAVAPRLLAAGAVGEQPYLVLELVPVPPLSRMLLDAPDGVELERFAAVMLPLLAAVERVHAAGVVHRDLKPENVLVEPGAPLKIIDFGLQLDGSVTAERRLTQQGVVVGTADYMAPEQCSAGAGASAIGPAADIYALGVIAYELLTGRVPFFGPAVEVRAAQAGRRPPRCAGTRPLPEALERLVLRCLAKQPGQRPADAGILARELRDALQGAPVAPVAPEGSTAQPAEQLVQALFLRSRVGVAELLRRAAALGADVVHQRDQLSTLVIVETDPEPAARTAEAMLRQGVCERVLVELVPATRRQGRGGKTLLVSREFQRPERFLGPEQPAGVWFGPAAAARASGALVEQRPGLFALGPARTPPPTVLAHEAPAPLVGRDRLLEALAGAAGAAMESRRPALAALLGEPGLGKSRLLAELAGCLRARGARVIEWQARERSDGADRQTLVTLALALAPLLPVPPGGAGADSADARLEAAAGEEWPFLAVALGRLEVTAPEIAALAVAPMALRTGMVRALIAVIAQAARGGPLALLLDDAHLADTALLDALELAAGPDAAGHGPLLVAMAAAPVLEAQRPRLRTPPERWRLERLSPLDDAASAALVRQLLLPASDVPAGAIARIAGRAGGVPALMVELVRALKRQGVLRSADRSGRWYLATDELDAGVGVQIGEWLASAELRSLPADLAAHARLLALLGTPITVAEVALVLDQLDRDRVADPYPLDAEVACRRLTSTGLIVQHRDGSIGFRNSLLRDALLATVQPELRLAVHRAALAVFRARDQARGASSAQTARHAAAAGLPELALSAYLELARAAASRHAYLDAEHAYSRALELAGATAGSRRDALIGRGTMRYRIGRYEDALADLLQAEALLGGDEPVEARHKLLLDQAMVLDWLGDYRRSREVTERVQSETLATEVSPPIRAELMMALGRSAWRDGELIVAADRLEEAARSSAALGADAYEIWANTQIMRGYVLPMVGRVDAADAVFAELLPALSRRRDLHHLSAAHNARICLWLARREPERILADLREHLRLSRELGASETYGEYNLAETLALLGRFEEALAHVVVAEERERALHGELVPTAAAILAARIHCAMGNEAAARRVRDRVAELEARARDHGADYSLIPNDLLWLDVIALASGDGDRSTWRQVLRKVRLLGGSDDRPAPDYVEALELRALWALRRGREREARRILGLALRHAEIAPSVVEVRIRARVDALASAASASATAST